MRQNILTLLLALLFINVVAPLPDANAQDLSGIAKVIHARADYTRSLAEAQLTLAQARLVDATTAGEWQEVRRLTLSVNRYELELSRLRRDERNVRKEIQRVSTLGRTASLILSGNTEPRALRALRFMQTRYIPAAVTRDAMSLPVGSLDESEFVGNTPDQDPVFFTGQNVGQLLVHLETHNLQLVAWSEGHLALVDALVLISEANEAELLSLEERWHELHLTLTQNH